MNKHDSTTESNTTTPPHNMGEGLKRNIANYLDGKVNRLSNPKRKFRLLVIGIIAALACLSLILYALQENNSGPIISSDTVTWPKLHIPEND